MELTEKQTNQTIKAYFLPEDFRDCVRDIFRQDDNVQWLEDLRHLSAKCYRFEPNHPRYDADRLNFPKVN